MRPIKNKPPKVSNIRFFPKTNLLAQALHEATEKLVEGEGATLRTGGDQVFVKRDMNHAAELRRIQKQKNNKKLLGYAEKVVRLGKASIKSQGNRENG